MFCLTLEVSDFALVFWMVKLCFISKALANEGAPKKCDKKSPFFPCSLPLFLLPSFPSSFLSSHVSLLFFLSSDRVFLQPPCPYHNPTWYQCTILLSLPATAIFSYAAPCCCAQLWSTSDGRGTDVISPPSFYPCEISISHPSPARWFRFPLSKNLISTVTWISALPVLWCILGALKHLPVHEWFPEQLCCDLLSPADPDTDPALRPMDPITDCEELSNERRMCHGGSQQPAPQRWHI